MKYNELKTFMYGNLNYTQIKKILEKEVANMNQIIQKLTKNCLTYSSNSLCYNYSSSIQLIGDTFSTPLCFQLNQTNNSCYIKPDSRSINKGVYPYTTGLYLYYASLVTDKNIITLANNLIKNSSEYNWSGYLENGNGLLISTNQGKSAYGCQDSTIDTYCCGGW